jgi:hypothetical protein
MIAISYEVLDGKSQFSTLLLDRRGKTIAQRTHTDVVSIDALRFVREGEVVMLMQRSLGTFSGYSLSFARWSHEDEFSEGAEALAELELLGSTIGLTSMVDGYLLSWEDLQALPRSRGGGQPTGGSLRFLQLDAEGRAAGEVRELLPPSQRPFQGRLVVARFHAALALFWQEWTRPCQDYDECNFADDRYAFTLVSAHNLEARSDVIPIPWSERSSFPSLYVRDGTFGLLGTHFSGAGALTPPIEIACAAK